MAARCDRCRVIEVRSYGAVCDWCRVPSAAEKLRARAEEATRERAERLRREGR